jgi:hypothetical protein
MNVLCHTTIGGHLGSGDKARCEILFPSDFEFCSSVSHSPSTGKRSPESGSKPLPRRQRGGQ